MRMLALLRGINVGGHNKIPMAELRELCAEIGWENVQSYIQSGNVVFSSTRPAAELEAELEAAIHQRFDFDISVIVRTAKEWQTYVAANPFADESTERPNHVLLGVSKAPLARRAAQEISARAVHGERVAQVAKVLWVCFDAAGIAKSKLTPAVLDRAAGSAVTGRNWRTVLKLSDMLKAGAGECA